MLDKFDIMSFLTEVSFEIAPSFQDFVVEAIRPMQYDKRFVEFRKHPPRRKSWSDETHSYRALIWGRIDDEVKEIIRKEPGYLALKELYGGLLKPLLRRHLINNRILNQTFSLAVLMPHLVDKLRDSLVNVPDFKVSNKFLKYASRMADDNKPEFLVWLAVIVMTESERSSEKKTKPKTKDPKVQPGLKKDVCGMDLLFRKAYDKLLPMVDMKKYNDDSIPLNPKIPHLGAA